MAVHPSPDLEGGPRPLASVQISCHALHELLDRNRGTLDDFDTLARDFAVSVLRFFRRADAVLDAPCCERPTERGQM